MQLPVNRPKRTTAGSHMFDGSMRYTTEAVSRRIDLAIQTLALLRAIERTSPDLAETLEPGSWQPATAGA